MELPKNLPPFINANGVHLVVDFRALFGIRGSENDTHNRDRGDIRNAHGASEPFHSSLRECILLVFTAESLPELHVAIRVNDPRLGAKVYVLTS